jgi:hypothetical protein
MYVDEVGNPDLRASADPNHRYLTLAGVIMGLDYVARVAQPRVENLKRRYFGSHPDEPVVLHRKELVNAAPPFHALRNPEVRARFDQELLTMLRQLDYTVVTVHIDKLAHVEQYKVWRYDPYHYCLEVLLERYVLWLGDRHLRGDVLAESRGGKEDRRLKQSYERLYGSGCRFIPPATLAERLTSRQLKVMPKSNNIAGLQVADLIAHPSYKAALARRNREALPRNFGGQIAAILEQSKYRRSPSGTIDGWGRKWLP